MKELFILVYIIIAFSAVSQNLIPNGGFELRDYNEAVSVSNPYRPCTYGQGPTATPWVKFGSIQNSYHQTATLFDSRYECIVDTYNQNPDFCDPPNCSDDQYLIGVPSNFYGYQEHRLLIDNDQVIGRYIGLVTDFFGNQGMKVEMTEPIQCGLNYNLEFYAVKKSGHKTFAHIRFSESGDWNDPIPYNSQGHTDYDVEVTETDSWQHITGTFQFENSTNNPVWMMVRISKKGSQQGRLLLDDFSFTQGICNINDQCSSTIGCIDVQILDHVDVQGHSSLIINGLEEVDNLYVEMSLINGQLFRTYNIPDPPFTWEWDGVQASGNNLPPGNYKYRIVVSNDCSFKEYNGITEKTNESLFNVISAATPAGLTFHNLDNVTDMTLKIRNQAQQLIYTENIHNPPNSIAWNGLTNSGVQVAPQIVNWFLDVSNDCESTSYSQHYSHIDPPEYYYLHDHTSISKPAFPCSDVESGIFNRSYDRAPSACCPYEPDVYIDNTKIWYNTEYKALNDIYIGSNVEVIGNNSGVLFQAGNSITISPGAKIADATLLQLIPCEKSGIYEDNSKENKPQVVDLNEELSGLITSQSPSNYLIYPNPASDNFTVLVNSESQNFKLKVSDIQGKIIISKLVQNTSEIIETYGWKKGIYICEISNGEDVFYEKLIVN